MKVLVITNLFPNSREPGRGIFNKQQFIELGKLCELKVVAPLPWRPRFVKSIYNEIAFEETIDSIRVYHPHYFVSPKIGRMFYGWSFYRGVVPLIERIQKDFPFDLIFATWGYPDVYASSLIAKKFNKPLVSRVHGTDINVIGKQFFQRQMMKKAFRHSFRVIANSKGLKKAVQEMGIAPDKIALIQNGVDKKLFRPLDKDDCRRQISLAPTKTHLMYIGNLAPIKGITYLIQAMKFLASPTVTLHIIGNGELENKLKAETFALGLGNNIVFHGRKAHADLPVWINAADVLCLPSLNEGLPNVILESLACGTPVAASSVGGVPDLIDSKDKGRLFPPQKPHAMASAIKEVLDQVKKNIKPRFEPMDWQDNAKEVYKIFEGAVSS